MTILRLSEVADCDIRLRRSARARRLSLRVSSLDGQVTLTIPRGVAMAEARGFLADRADWIRTAREQAQRSAQVRPGMTVPVDGIPRIVETGLRTKLSEDRIVVPPAKPGTAIMGMLKTLAREKLCESSDRHAGRVGKSYSAISLRDTRSRWGSCTSTGRLMFSWRLVMAPPRVLDYVAAHEVAHLVHMNHGPEFWKLVGTLVPDWRAERSWLRTHGPSLHAYRFRD